MTDEEYCGTICYAARRMGFVIKRIANDGNTSFLWRDLMTQAQIEGPGDSCEKTALKKACDKLTNYLKAK